MLTQLLLYPVFLLIKIFLALMPVVNVPSGFVAGFDTFFSMLAAAGYFLPLKTLAIALSFFVLWYGFVFIVAGVNWVIAKIPTIN